MISVDKFRGMVIIDASKARVVAAGWRVGKVGSSANLEILCSVEGTKRIHESYASYLRVLFMEGRLDLWDLL